MTSKSEYLFKHHLVQFFPQMKVRHPLYPLMVLRATCRGMIKLCLGAMAHQSNFLRGLHVKRLRGLHRNQAVPWLELSDRQWAQLERLRCSGFLCQAWRPISGMPEFQYKLQCKGLLFDSRTGRPVLMTQEYWEQLWQRCGRNFGWVDSKLML